MKWLIIVYMLVCGTAWADDCEEAFERGKLTQWCEQLLEAEELFEADHTNWKRILCEHCQAIIKYKCSPEGGSDE